MLQGFTHALELLSATPAEAVEAEVSGDVSTTAAVNAHCAVAAGGHADGGGDVRAVGGGVDRETVQREAAQNLKRARAAEQKQKATFNNFFDR